MVYSLFIGRFQPFHDGHKAIVQQLLDEGKRVCVAIRDTPISDKDPFTYEQRVGFIREQFSDEAQVKIIKIPDIEEACYGRKVGYTVREMRMGEEIEEISATNIRKEMGITK